MSWKRSRSSESQYRERAAALSRRSFRARYERTLRLLEYAKELDSKLITKSGVMVGLGEEMHELLDVFRDLARVGTDILTIGQYLRPSKDHLPMVRIYTPRSSRG